MEGEGSQILELVAEDVDRAACLDLGLDEEDGGFGIDWDQFFLHEVDRCLSPSFSFPDLLDHQSPSSLEILEHQLPPPSQLLPLSLPSSISSSPDSLISSFTMDNFEVKQQKHPNPDTSTDNPPTPSTDDSQLVRAPTIEDTHDPLSRKRARKMRNRDAAVRSRERKKMYIRDLEMKSRYLEGECRRLNRLLHCCYAENHALRLTLHSGSAYGAPMAKQESAVLLMESLLLGSLHWFLGVICLLILPTMPVLQLPGDLLRNVEGLERVPLRWARSETTEYSIPQSLALNRKYKASRTRIKSDLLALLVLVYE